MAFTAHNAADLRDLSRVAHRIADDGGTLQDVLRLLTDVADAAQYGWCGHLTPSVPAGPYEPDDGMLAQQTLGDVDGLVTELIEAGRKTVSVKRLVEITDPESVRDA